MGTTLSKPRFRVKMTTLLVILLSVISFVTSYEGLLILNGSTEGTFNLWQNVFVAFIVFTIQVTLVATLLFTIHGHYTITRILSFVVYLVAMLFSVFFSYGWWYEIFRANSYAEEVYKGSIEQIRTDAKTYQAAFAHAHSMANELSNYSAQKARQENLYGGTCDSESLPGRGALNYLRDDEAKLFLQVAGNVENLERDVGANITELNRLLTNFSLAPEDVKKRELELNDTVTTIGSYRTGTAINQIKNELVARRGEKRRSLDSSNPKTLEHTTVSCLDATMTEKIDGLITALDELPLTKKITLFDQSNRRTVLQRAWQVFSVFWPFGDEGSLKERATILKLTNNDFFPVVAGLLIDLFILLLGFIDGLEYGRLYAGKRFSIEEAQHLAAFNQKEMLDNDQLALLKPYLYSGIRHHYLIVPVAQDVLNEREQQVHRLLAWLEAHKKIRDFAHGVKLSHLPSLMQAFFQADPDCLSRHIHRYDIYRIDKRVWRELVISHARTSSLLHQEAM